MKTYRVNVNGNEYEISIEDISGTPSSYAATPVRNAAPAPARVPAAAPRQTAAPVMPKPAAAPAAATNGTQVTAPMPGNIITVKVSDGQSIKKGDVLMILEAMKMENEIMAPCDGTIQSLSAAAGSAVTSGALLCVIQ
ncbi:MAG: biotin/lipoyl-containing protein [Lachnospiraceae bacterium]